VADIFISYSKQSKAETERLAQELQAKGFTVWYDTSLVAGDSFRETIISEIGQAGAAIVIWDAASVKSEWVCSEASRARARGILVPVRTDGVRSHDIPPPFDSLHTELLSNRAGIDAALARLGVAPGVTMEARAPPPAINEPTRPSVHDKPSIAVLSFTNMTGDPDQEYFGDGIAEDIITMLSRSRSLFVGARNSSFSFKRRAVDVKQIAHELGVRYVLEGSVRRGGNRVRITAQLIDAETGNHVWAERYDCNVADVFAVQDEITEAVVIAIEPAVVETERRRAARKPPQSLGAWEAYHRGMWHYARNSAAENKIAKQFLRRAIAADRNFALAHAMLAMSIFMDGTIYQTISIAEALVQGIPHAQKAVSLDPLEPGAHVIKGWAMIIQGDLEDAIAEGRQALALSPNSASGNHVLGAALIYSGRQREGIEHIHASIRLDPHDPVLSNTRMRIVAAGHYFLGDYMASLDAAKAFQRTYPDNLWTDRWLAAALGQLGRQPEARQALERAIALAPQAFSVFTRQRVPFMRLEDYEHLLAGWRKAGWEG
jgi:TolB-like protein